MDIIRHYAIEAMKEYNGGTPVKGPVWAIMSFCYNAGPDEVTPRLGRPDWDNLGKLVCDACNGIVYEDDAQIVSATVHKWTLKGHAGTRCMFWFTGHPF